MHCVLENCVARIVVASRIKFRFKLRVEQSETISTIVDKVQQYYINISSRIAILKVKKLECQKNATCIAQKLILINENILQNSKLILLGNCSACYASPMSIATKNSVLKGTRQRQSMTKKLSLTAAIPSQLKKTVQDQARPCLHVSRHTLQAKKSSDCVTLRRLGASGAIGDCLSSLCPSTY